MCLLRGTDWVFIYNSSFCPHSVFVCFVWIWEQTAIISLYSINWLVFITETVCLLRGTDWVFIYNSTFCPHSVFMCVMWIWEQTAIISLYSINWLIFITETECVHCAVRTGCYISFRRTSESYVMCRSLHTTSRSSHPLPLQLCRAASLQPPSHFVTRDNRNLTQFHSLTILFSVAFYTKYC